MLCFLTFKVNRRLPRPLEQYRNPMYLPESHQYNNMRSNIQMVGRMYQLEFSIRNKSRGVSYIPGSEISSLIMQIRRGRPTRDASARSDGATKPQDRRVLCVWCGSGRPLLMQRHVQKTIREGFCFITLPLARTTDSCSHVSSRSCADRLVVNY